MIDGEAIGREGRSIRSASALGVDCENLPVEQIGEWSSMNDPAERFIELFGRVDRIATGTPQ